MISHLHKVVFIHIPKCGGQSVESVYLSDLGLDWSNRVCLNLQKNPNKGVGPNRLAHLTAREYVDLNFLNQSIWSEYEKFTLIREPVARAMSAYKYLGFSVVMDFSHFIERVIRPAVVENSRYTWFLRPQVDFLINKLGKIDDGIRIFRLEHLEELELFLRSSVLKGDAILPHINASKKNALEVLGAAANLNWKGYIGLNFRGNLVSRSDREALRDIYSEDYSLLGY